MRIYFLFLIVLSASCQKDKYQAVNGDVTLTGYVYLADTVNLSFPVPLAGKQIYLNLGSDSSTYNYKAVTDSAGKYSIPFLRNDKDYILFTRYINTGFEYEGVQKVNGGAINNIISVDLYVQPKFSNGIALLFTDTLNGLLPNLPFRLYKSRLAAQYDSVLYAVAVTTSDINARYSKLNISPAKYYAVASKTFGTLKLQVFDSVTISGNGLFRKTMQLR